MSKYETSVAYSDRILELVCELEQTKHAILDLKKKQALLRGSKKDFEATAKAIIDESFTYHEAIPKLTVPQLQIQESDKVAEETTVAQKGP